MSEINYGSKLISGMGYEIPSHTQMAIENYLIHGYNPGGFLSAMFAGDLHRAASSADVANSDAWKDISCWIVSTSPMGSWGSYDKIKEWCDDMDGQRTRYATMVEQNYMVHVLSKT